MVADSDCLMMQEKMKSYEILMGHNIFFRFSPELHMVRPPTENDYWRLDRILQRKAVRKSLYDVDGCISDPLCYDHLPLFRWCIFKRLMISILLSFRNLGL